MNLARTLERRLERLLEGTTGRVFSGRIHPSELAGRIAREADLSQYRHESGPATANHYLLIMNPTDLAMDTTALEHELQQALAEHAAETGLIFEGPPTVHIETSEALPPGKFECRPSVVRGDLPTWARLVSGRGTIEIGANRVIIGRSDDADVVIPVDSVSRRHASIFRAEGKPWIQDLGSSNGTTVDGEPVGPEPRRLTHGAMITLADQSFRFLEG